MPLSSCAVISWPLRSKAPLYPSLGHREKQQPSSKPQQSFSFILACSPSPPHAVPSTAPNSSICPAGCWQEATAVSLLPNFDWPASSSHSRVLHFFLAFFRRHLRGNGNHFGSDPGSFPFCAPADAHRENRVDEERRNLL